MGDLRKKSLTNWASITLLLTMSSTETLVQKRKMGTLVRQRFGIVGQRAITIKSCRFAGPDQSPLALILTQSQPSGGQGDLPKTAPKWQKGSTVHDSTPSCRNPGRGHL